MNNLITDPGRLSDLEREAIRQARLALRRREITQAEFPAYAREILALLREEAGR